MALTPVALLLAFFLGAASYHFARSIIESRVIAAGGIGRSDFVEEDAGEDNYHTLGYILSGLTMALGLVLTHNLVTPMTWTDYYGFLINGAVLLFLAVGLVLSWIDLETRTLPSKLIYWGLGSVLALLIIAAITKNGWSLLIPMAIGGVFYFLVYFLIWFLKPGAFGLGDVRLSFFLGAFLAFLSPTAAVVGFVATWLLALVGIIIGAIFGTVNRKTQIAFGPWMILGSAVGLFFGEPIVTMLAL